MTKKLKGQQSLFFEATEGLNLIKCADLARSVKVTVHQYKGRESYGLHINGACVAKDISKADVEAGQKVFEGARDNWAMTLAHRGSQILSNIVPRLSEEIKPTKSRNQETVGQENPKLIEA